MGRARRSLVTSEEMTRPIVTIQITREGTTPGQKAALIKGATDLLRDVLGKPPSWTFVVIQEVELEDWGVGGFAGRRVLASGRTWSTGLTMPFRSGYRRGFPERRTPWRWSPTYLPGVHPA